MLAVFLSVATAWADEPPVIHDREHVRIIEVPQLSYSYFITWHCTVHYCYGGRLDIKYSADNRTMTATYIGHPPPEVVIFRVPDWQVSDFYYNVVVRPDAPRLR